MVYNIVYNIAINNKDVLNVSAVLNENYSSHSLKLKKMAFIHSGLPTNHETRMYRVTHKPWD